MRKVHTENMAVAAIVTTYNLMHSRWHTVHQILGGVQIDFFTKEVEAGEHRTNVQKLTNAKKGLHFFGSHLTTSSI